MSDKPKINLALYWHMHQPEYRDPYAGRYTLPWTYLHIIKDYVDMAAHLEAHPKAYTVVNFTPTLLEQIEDYQKQFDYYRQHGDGFHDPLLEALASPLFPQQHEQRMMLVKQCTRANEQRLIQRFPVFQRLAQMAEWLQEHPDTIHYISDQYLADLLTWYHLAWLGETVRRNDTRIIALIEKAMHFSLHDRNTLLHVMAELVAGVIDRYKALAERGQVELSMTPYAHPIMPLLLDISSARQAMPDVDLPSLSAYPGGEQRSRWHIEHGIEVFERFFGFRPKGCWPAEGSVSEETIALLSEYGFTWLASGETVLRNSLKRSGSELAKKGQCVHRAYQYDSTAAACFFRDDGLSDLIGFTYSTWHADDAVANLVHHLENIADACKDEHALVSIILDGENAWEFYPENGYYFLDALYRTLSEHKRIRLTTYSDYLQREPERHTLRDVVAGSWVYGTFSTWIGDKDKNHGWDMLGEAKRAYDHHVKTNNIAPDKLELINRQLAICEGSDWFWWFGDYNPSDTVNDFDYLYRLQLSDLYLLLGLEPPDYLSEAFSHGSGAPAMGGAMRPGKEG
jgi:alpha-amylase/alpha-mannosidase (GH57 family)